MDTSKRPKRPADINQLANLVGRIATGEAEEQVDDTDPKARKRGEARAKKLTPKQRSEIARRPQKPDGARSDFHTLFLGAFMSGRKLLGIVILGMVLLSTSVTAFFVIRRATTPVTPDVQQQM